MSLIILNLVLNMWTNVILAPDSLAVKIDFSINTATEAIEIGFIHRGVEYKVARLNNQSSSNIWRDSFTWYSQSKWQGGDLKITAVNKYDKEECFIHENDFSVKDFYIRKAVNENNSPSQILNKNYGDQYAWRMFGYDPQNTGHYPYVLHAPLEFKWRSYWPYWGGGNATMISGCAAYGRFYIGDGRNYVQCVDIETGQIVWNRRVTSNTWTCALCPGESILFVGCSIGFGNDTTFYALDPNTGTAKWGKVLTTVEYSPIAVDSITYVCDLGLPKQVYAFTLQGRLLWSKFTDGSFSPTYCQEKVYHTSANWGRVLNCRNALTEDSLWIFSAPSSMSHRTIDEGKIFFFLAKHYL